MSKFFALFINEMIKISKKVSVIVIVAIMIVGVIGFGGLIKIQEIAMSKYVDDPGQNKWEKEQLEQELLFMNERVSELEKAYEVAQSEEEKSSIQNEMSYLKSTIDIFELGLELEVYPYGQGYRSEVLNELISVRSNIAYYENIPSNEMTEEMMEFYNALKLQETTYLEILENNDFEAYINMQINKIEEDMHISEEEKEIMKEVKLLWLAVDPDGSKSSVSGGGVSNSLNQIEQMKRSLLHNVEYSYSWGGGAVKPLTPQGREKLENDIAVLVYQLENGIEGGLDFSSNRSMREAAITGMMGFGSFMIIILILILAGGTVSQEISSGSIKSLIISPTKRYKIFFAKLTSILTVGIASTFVLYIIAILAYGLFFGFSQVTPYVYASGGVASEISFYLHRFAILMVDYLDVIVYMIMALMLSVITRNTAIAVGVSVSVYFGGSIVNQFVSFFAKGDWTKFIPFNNMGLGQRVFPTTVSDMGMNLFGNSLTLPSVTFSLIYLLVTIICFGYIALDSFNRRDIK